MNMIEKVARSQSDFDKRPWLSMSKADRERYLERAKRAIEAMKEPTDKMIEARNTVGLTYSNMMNVIWVLMIEAALKD